VETEAAPAPAPEPLPEDPDLFWRSPGKDIGHDKEVASPRLNATLVKCLGNFPMWRSDEPFIESLEGIYAAASSVGLDVYVGDRT
jgi:uncharacterized Zn finger protein